MVERRIINLGSVHNAMVKTGSDLLIKFKPFCVFTCSDEFTMGFLQPGEKSVHPYGGRVQKLVSSTAGFTSARFNYHLLQQNYDGEPEVCGYWVNMFYFLVILIVFW